jgi:glycosyltransferase involved in cell wall biosynthesis
LDHLPLRIAAIIPTFNRAHTLHRAIESVLAQKSPAHEIIVVDDGSTDDTEQLVTKYINSHENFRYFRQENSGVSAARNAAINASECSWFSFLDSDDEWLPEKLELQTQLIQEKPHLKIVHGEERWIRNGRFVNQMKKHRKSGGLIYQRCLERCLISPSAVLIHKDVFKSSGLFREDFPVCEDYDLWLKITSCFEVGFIDHPLIVKYGGHEDQLSQKYAAMDHWRVLSMLDMLQNANLKQEDRMATEQELERKSSYLRKGYLKRGKQTELRELNSRISKISLSPRI